jgi:hypothetical protein
MFPVLANNKERRRYINKFIISFERLEKKSYFIFINRIIVKRSPELLEFNPLGGKIVMLMYL